MRSSAEVRARLKYDKILACLIDRYEYASHLVDMDEISDDRFQEIKRETEQLLFYYAGACDGELKQTQKLGRMLVLGGGGGG